MIPSKDWGGADQKAGFQNRSNSPYEMHRLGQLDAVYNGNERSPSQYDPLKESTEYEGASHI
ncbi:hypothetical protein J3458_001774 [Metarhizium acridum]|uniref:uncharacterized protein n=1 Tax=Metarhizium acridum TaxID=92637 RepID=UPI001C6C3182|nr:hypothetical protein J3458_001774 [Metarhizium acridum]